MRNPTLEDKVWCSISELARLLRDGAVSSVQVTQSLVNRITETEPRLHAYVGLMTETAMREAENADAEFKRGRVKSKLQGVPLGIKDLCETEGFPTSAGSRVLEGNVPTRDADVVRLLRSAGAVLIGKTVTHEFAYGLNIPDTRNAWNQSCYPGGSSAGSAVAVAAGTAYGAVGTDTGGSIRVPASVNGVVGLKPTFGLVSKVGVFPMSPTLDTVGPITRTVEDAALMLEVMSAGGESRHAPIDRKVTSAYSRTQQQNLSGMRIGLERDYFFGPAVQPDVAMALEAGIAQLRELGAEIVDVTISHLDLTVPAGTAVLMGDTSEWHQSLLRSRGDSYARETRVMLEAGEFLYATAYVKAQKVRAVLKEEVRRAFEGYRLDALVTPTLPATAPLISELDGDLTGGGKLPGFLAHCFLANVVGIPALSIPAGFDSNALPIGMQLYGRPFGESRLLRIGHAFQSITDWHERHPAG